MKTNETFISDWNNVLDCGRNELVFENRNKSYGAYVIRQEHHKSVVWAMILSFSFISFLALVPAINNWLKLWSVEEIVPINEIKKTGKNETIIDFILPPKQIKEKTSGKIKTQMMPTKGAPLKHNTQLPTVVVDTILPESTQNQTFASIEPAVNVNGMDGVIEDFPTIENDPTSETATIEPRTFSDRMPEFPGGLPAMYSYISSHLKYPNHDASGKVYLKFVVDKTGYINNVEVQQGIQGYPEFEREAVRIIKGMPKWIPGQQNGNPVAVYYNLPISFTLR